MATNYKSSAKKRRGDPAHALIGQQPMFYQSIEKRKGVFFFFATASQEHSRTIEKCRKQSPAACVFYISLVFSNAVVFYHSVIHGLGFFFFFFFTKR